MSAGHEIKMSAGHGRCQGAIGLIFMALSAISFSIMSLFVHILTTGLKPNTNSTNITTATNVTSSITRMSINSFELVSMRAIFGAILCSIWIYSQQQLPLGEKKYRTTLGARASIGVIGMMCNWFILSQLPLGDATVIIFTAPTFTLLLARCILKEKVSYMTMILLFVSSIGVILVARPTFLGFHADIAPAYEILPRGIVVLIGLIGAVASAATNVIVRKLTNVPAMVTVLWLMMAGILVATPVALAMPDSKLPETVGDVVMIVFICLLGFAGQGFKTQGLKWEKAGIGSMMRNLDLVFAFTFQIVVLGEQLRSLSVVGALLTLSSSVCMGVLKVRGKRKESGDGGSSGGGSGERVTLGGSVEMEVMLGMEGDKMMTRRLSMEKNDVVGVERVEVIATRERGSSVE